MEKKKNNKKGLQKDGVTDLHALKDVLKVTISTHMRRAVVAVLQPISGAVVQGHGLRVSGGGGRVGTVVDEEKRVQEESYCAGAVGGGHNNRYQVHKVKRLLNLQTFMSVSTHAHFPRHESIMNPKRVKSEEILCKSSITRIEKRKKYEITEISRHS